ncbi:MAG: hypothetical protein AB3N14_13885, partial [Flavobacteriaceae bacterium]
MIIFKVKNGDYQLRRKLRNFLTCLLFIGSLSSFAQKNPSISSSVDTTFIKIGEQINFKVVVEADSTAQVIFP